MPQFCAICLSDRGPFTLDDGLLECERCRTERPIAVDSSRPAYAGGNGPAMTPRDMNVGARRAMGDAEYARASAIEIRYGMTPAHRLTQEEVDMQQVSIENVRRHRTGAAQKQTSIEQRRAQRKWDQGTIGKVR